MNIHEHQAKQILKKYGAVVPEGVFALTVEDLVEKAKSLKTKKYVLKAQIHAGGRGKAGGVKILETIEELSEAAKELMGKTLVTHQTGPEGKTVHKVYIEEGTDIKKEFYLGLVFDRSSESIMVIASSEGGMSIEEIAEEKPESIVKTKVEAAVGLQAFQAREIAFGLGLDAKSITRCADAIMGCSKAFSQHDATMVEINPLVRTENDEIIALDAKVSFDENAFFRHPDVFNEMRDLAEEEETEIKAEKAGLSYVKLDGEIGCLVNGAGLAMATMDVIKLYGGDPANFLDVGGGADEEAVKTAFGIILDDPNVKGIMVNIFGGIMRCDIIARGIIAATESLSVEVPLVVRLSGTNFQEGRDILSASGLDIYSVETLAEGAQKIVQLIGGDV